MSDTTAPAMSTGTTMTLPPLPVDLAPSLAAQVVRLLTEVTPTTAPPLLIDLSCTGPRCVVCHQAGKLGGHHGHDGQIEWIHRKCHRRLHRAGRPAVSGATRHRVLERRRGHTTRTAC